MNIQKTAEIFKQYANADLTNVEAEDIERNLQEYFALIISWYVQETEKKG